MVYLLLLGNNSETSSPTNVQLFWMCVCVCVCVYSSRWQSILIILYGICNHKFRIHYHISCDRRREELSSHRPLNRLDHHSGSVLCMKPYEYLNNVRMSHWQDMFNVGKVFIITAWLIFQEMIFIFKGQLATSELGSLLTSCSNFLFQQEMRHHRTENCLSNQVHRVVQGITKFCHNLLNVILFLCMTFSLLKWNFLYF